jgi:uncharacterized lipoprotein YmbA
MMRIPVNAMRVALLTVFLSGCISSSPPARFYTLHSEAPSADTALAVIGDEWVGVGPIDMPDYLDRPQIVTRGDGHRLIVHEFDRWADPLKNRVLNVLMDNVVRLSDSKRVAPYPWSAPFRPDRRVVGEITAFEAGPTGDVVLRARWTVHVPGEVDEAEIRISEYREAAPHGDFDAMAGAMSRALARWSRDIASALSESAASNAP